MRSAQASSQCTCNNAVRVVWGGRTRPAGYTISSAVCDAWSKRCSETCSETQRAREKKPASDTIASWQPNHGNELCNTQSPQRRTFHGHTPVVTVDAAGEESAPHPPNNSCHRSSGETQQGNDIVEVQEKETLQYFMDYIYSQRRAGLSGCCRGGAVTRWRINTRGHTRGRVQGVRIRNVRF